MARRATPPGSAAPESLPEAESRRKPIRNPEPPENHGKGPGRGRRSPTAAAGQPGPGSGAADAAKEAPDRAGGGKQPRIAATGGTGGTGIAGRRRAQIGRAPGRAAPLPPLPYSPPYSLPHPSPGQGRHFRACPHSAPPLRPGPARSARPTFCPAPPGGRIPDATRIHPRCTGPRRAPCHATSGRDQCAGQSGSRARSVWIVT